LRQATIWFFLWKSSTEAEIPFDVILDHVTATDPSVTHYILQQPAKCPNCKSEVLEETLVVTAIFILTSCVLLAVQKLQPNTVGKWSAFDYS